MSSTTCNAMRFGSEIGCLDLVGVLGVLVALQGSVNGDFTAELAPGKELS